MKKEKIAGLLTYEKALWLVAILFLILFLILSFFNRLAADDYYFLGAQKHIGVVECVQQSYADFSGRWFAYTVTCWLLQFSHHTYLLFVFEFCLLLFLVLSIYQLLHKINFVVGINMLNKERFLFSLLFSTCFFFSNFGVSETWFWYTSVCSYLLSLVALLFLLSEISRFKFTVIGSAGLFLLPLFIGGASESFALVSILCLCFLVILSFTKNEKLNSIIKKNHRIKILISLGLLILSFSVTAMAPGNFIRLSMLPHPSAIQQIISPFKALAKVGFLVLKDQLLYLMLFSSPWFFLGVEQRNKELISVIAFLNQIKLILFGLVILIFLMLFPSTLLLNETPPVRALSQVSFVLCLSFALLCFSAGRQVKLDLIRVRKLKRILISITVLVLVFHIQNQFRITKKYAERVDMRMELLSSPAMSAATNIVLSRLPESGMLYSAEISNDSAFYSNQHLQHALDLKSGVRRN